MKYILVIFLLVLSVCNVQPVKAASDADSLALLVKTLNSNDNPQVRAILMKGMLSGLAGRRNVEPPKGWKELSKKLTLSEHAEEQALFQQLSQIFGDTEATERALATVDDPNADIEARRTSLRSLLAQQNDQVSMKLEILLDDPAIRLDAIRGYAAIENASAPQILLGRYTKFDESMRRAAIENTRNTKGLCDRIIECD